MKKAIHNPDKNILTIDLNFLGLSGAIAVYLLPHPYGAALVECGPSSTIPALQAGLKEHGYTVSDISDVFLTHIHLDHAGASGWLARQGARIHVHPVGAPHLLDPTKLLASAARIYGDSMDTLWGEFLPVPPDHLSVLELNHSVEVHGLEICPLDTPGHAYHHFAYLFNNTCFSGDVGGIRMHDLRHLRLPMPPPEFNLEKWRDSLAILKEQDFDWIAPTHFGLFDDPVWHLNALQRALDEIEAWMEANLSSNPSFDRLNEEFFSWAKQCSLADGVPPELIDLYEAANPSWMSTSGILRYWQKYRMNKA
jgi:glyoxylase-like metal-dependent hydrolase (beta-lactamase superfamily II)